MDMVKMQNLMHTIDVLRSANELITHGTVKDHNKHSRIRAEWHESLARVVTAISEETKKLTEVK